MLTTEEVDLATVVEALERRFGATLEQDYLDGRTVLRDAVADHLACSILEAEALVDTLEAQGYLKFPKLQDETHSRRAVRWRITRPR
jgi:hypothetical protein